MATTLLQESSPDLSFEFDESASTDDLVARYRALVRDHRLAWTTHYQLGRVLGSGGQGVVYFGHRAGADGFLLPVALKLFTPQLYIDAADYEADMRGVALTVARVAQIQHDHLLDVHNFVESGGIRILVMEWIDGYDLKRLLTREMLSRTQQRAGAEQWKHLSKVIVGSGVAQPLLKPGVAIQVFRECLAGLAALHRAGVVHGDLKPSNIMLKRTGNAKIIDIGSAIDLAAKSRRRLWTPAYVAPEVLRGAESSPQSDIASLGYVLIEILSGQPLFARIDDRSELLDAKRKLSQQLPRILPPDVACNKLLLSLCHRLIEPDPARRIESAEAANLDQEGAAEFHRQLVKGGLASEYENDLRVWLEHLP
jgi:serine/threonine-protein kinase